MAATEWSTEPQVTWQSLHNSNPYLVHDGIRGVTTHRLELSVPVSAESDLYSVRLAPQLNIVRNPGWSLLDRDEQTINLDADRTTEFGNYGLHGDYIHDTTLTSEFLDTGYVGIKKWRGVWSVDPYLNMTLSPSTTLMMSMKYRNQRYQDAAATPLVGYDYTQASMTIARELDDRDVLRCGVDYARTHTGMITSEDTGGHCQLSREMNERLRGSLMLGGHRALMNYNAETQSRSGSLLSLNLDYDTDSVRWGLLGSRSIEPSGYGLLVQTDQLTLTLAYEINERLSANVTVSAYNYVMTTPLYNLPYPLPQRDYDVAQWRIVWQLQSEWSLSGGVDYTRQRYSNQATYAEATTFLIQLNYRFDNR